MNTYKQIDPVDIPCKAYHKGLAYQEVTLLTYKWDDGKVYFKYLGGLQKPHNGWAYIKHFVKKIP